jgi:DNA repair protein RAD5
MIDCPTVLYSGADLVVSLSIYLRASAFTFCSSSIGEAKDNNLVMFSDGQETQDEQLLRERKSSLLHMFDAIALKPRGARHYDQKGHHDTTAPVDTRQRKGTVRTEIVGDGEEIEVEEGEDLTENELDMIYKR